MLAQLSRSPTEREPVNEAIGLHRTHVEDVFYIVWLDPNHNLYQ